MSKRTFVDHVVFMAIIFSSVSFLHAMEPIRPTQDSEIKSVKSRNAFDAKRTGSNGFTPPKNRFLSPLPNNLSIVEKRKQDIQKTKEANVYNNDAKRDIFSYVVQYLYSTNKNKAYALQESIIHYLKIREVCKHAYTFLTMEKIIEFCKGKYGAVNVNAALKRILKATASVKLGNLSDSTIKIYQVNRRPLGILVGLGGKPKHDYDFYDIVEVAIHRDDKPLIKILMENNIKPKMNQPLWLVKTKDMAQLLIKHNFADVHKKIDWDKKSTWHENLLWEVVEGGKPAELIKLYLEHGVDTKQLDSLGDCLLHQVIYGPKSVFPEPLTQDDITERLKQAKLLLDAAPDMINHKNHKGQTPLDIIPIDTIPKPSVVGHKNFLIRSGNIPVRRCNTLNDELRILYRNYGALTSAELAEREREK